MSTSRASSLAAIAGVIAIGSVGASVAVSAVLVDAPVLTTQALRYAGACALLVLLARLLRARIHWPVGVEWLWLSAVAVVGLAVFNAALVIGSRHAEPAVFGVAVACVPIVLAVLGPVMQGKRPAARLLLAAAVVSAGAALVAGSGRADAFGLAWAVVVLGCEAGFTLLAVPVLQRLGAWTVSVFTTGIAAITLTGVGVAFEGPAAVFTLTITELAAVGYLTVVVTAVAFVLWYFCVATLGPGTAGLFAGVAPVAAALTALLLGGQAPAPIVWVGIALTAAGILIGLRATSRHPAGTVPPTVP